MLTGVNDPITGVEEGQLFDPRSSTPFPANVIPPSTIDPAGAGILAFYPAPDNPNAAGPSGATVAPVGRNKIHQFTVRADQPLGAEERLFYRYSFWDENRFNPFDPLQDPTNVPGFGSLVQSRGQSLAVGWTKAGGQGLINDFRFGFNRLRGRGLQENVGDDVSSRLGILGLRTDPIAVGRPGVRLATSGAIRSGATASPTSTSRSTRTSAWESRKRSSYARKF